MSIKPANGVTISTVAESGFDSIVSDEESIAESFRSTPLFGRGNELIELENAYLRVKENKSFEKVIVHGESGTGKTKLVLALQKSVLRGEGFFCSGKYFQNTEQDPYSAIMAAFSDLCDLVSQSEDFNEERRATIEKGLGSDGLLLVNAISNISAFLGQKSSDESCGNLSQKSFPLDRFKVACKRFIRAIASDNCPVILFIDDIQWMDQGSRQLLEALLQDKLMKNFMLIMTYREEEKSLISDDFFTTARAGIDLKLGNLDLESVNEMICETLGTASNNALFDIDDLCKVVANKTHGNPFHVLNFMEMIAEDGLLTFDDESFSWTCDVDAIQKNTMIPDSSAEIISNKIKRLGTQLQTFLKIISLIGYRFTYEIIRDISTETTNGNNSAEEDEFSLALFLETAVESNILEETSGGYQFTHDKIQAAIQDLIDTDEKEQLHLQIGTTFLKRSGKLSKYFAARHINCLTSNTANNFDAIMLARTNLQAAKYCECRYAFINAVDFIRAGLALLGDGEEKWSTDYELAFELTESLVKLEFILGNMDSCKQANQSLLLRTKSERRRINALAMELEILTNTDTQFKDTVSIGRKILGELGIKVPCRLTVFHLISKVKRVRKLIDGHTDEQILNLDRINAELSDVTKVILLVSAQFFRHKKLIWALYANILAMEYTMMNGLSPGSVTTFCYLGVCETLIVRNIERGFRLGRLAQKLNRLHNTLDDGTINNLTTIALSWHKELIHPTALHFVPNQFHACLENGNFGIAMTISYFTFFVRFWTGEHLTSLQKSMDEIYERLNELGQKGTVKRFQPLLQLLQHLRKEAKDDDNEDDKWEEMLTLTGEYMDETEYRNQLTDDAAPALHAQFWFCKTIIAYTLGYNSIADLLSRKIQQKRGMLLTKSFLILPFTMYKAIIYFARYRETRNRKYLHDARKCQKLLKRFHSAGNPNALPHLRLLDAEERSLKLHDPSKLQSVYDNAIEIQGQAGFTHLEAITNEQASNALSRFGYDDVAKRYLDAAKFAYRDKWGVALKYEWLIAREDSQDSM